MVSYAFTSLLGTANPSFSTNITDLEIAWINGQARLYTAALPGPGAGYAAFDISQSSGPASLMALQGYSSFIAHHSSAHLAVFANQSGGANLIAAGLTPSGWAGYALTGSGSFGGSLNSPLSVDPIALTGLTVAGTTYLYMAVEGSSLPQGYVLGGNGTLTALSNSGLVLGGANQDDLTTVATAAGTYLVSVSASGNMISSYSVGANGALTLAGQTSSQIGTGFSKPTEVDSLTIGGTSFVIVAASESSSLSVFRMLPTGELYHADHVVDSLTTRFAGATALATLQIGSQGFVFVGGSDGGVEVMTLLPDGRLIGLLTIADTATMSLDHVAALAVAQVGARTQLFATSATEGGITQLDINLGPVGITVNQTAGVQTGTAANDLLVAGTGTTSIYGGQGDDLIVAGGQAGAAQLYGGAGADVFVLSPSTSVLTVMDYQAGIDRLDLTSFPMLRNIGQLTISSTATGAEIQYQGTTIRIESFDGNPIPVTAFAQSQMLHLTRFSPVQTTTTLSGTPGQDTLLAGTDDTSLLGLAGDDLLVGAVGNDLLDGGLGNDTLIGGLGRDRLLGGLGNDWLFAGAGNDLLDGGDGDDLLDGEDGNDTLFGGAGSDSLNGIVGDDYIEGGDGTDHVWSGSGNDTVYGGNDADAIAGVDGNDVLYCDAGNDILWGDLGNDTLYGGTGWDTLHGGDGLNLLDGGDDGDLIYGGALDDRIYGGNGHDYVLGIGGSDLIYGGSGNDSITGMDGNDSLYGDDGDDLLWGDDGDDFLYGGNGSDTLHGWNGTNFLDGGADADTLFGGPLNDLLYGGGGDDFILGVDGNDSIWGGDGNDYINGILGNDSCFGGEGNDAITGNDGEDIIMGDNGDDILWGDFGNDSLYGGAGNDTLHGGPGLNYLDGGANDDLIFGERQDDLIQGGDGQDVLVGIDGADTIYGGNGNDALIGLAGADRLYGGAGADCFVYGSAADAGIGTGSDVIFDFTKGQDKISFAGMGLTFAGVGSSGASNELHYYATGGGSVLWADVTGDGAADFTIWLQGIYTLSSADFYL